QARRLWLRRTCLRRVIFSGLLNLVALSAIGSVLFMLLWGLNYEREPLAKSMGLERRQTSIDELESICRIVISETNRNYDEASAKLGKRTPSRNRLYSSIEASYQQESLLLGNAAGGGFGPPKPVYFSRLMSWFGISGIYVPFTGEANFNAEQPGCELPFTIAH